MSDPSQHPRRSERAANILFGVNVWAWALLGLINSAPEEQWHSVRLCIALIHVVVGLLFIMRRPLIRGGSGRDIVVVIPAVLISGLAFNHAPSCSEWPWPAVILFLAGTIFTIAAFAFLAGNFAVLPAVRGVTATGPYRMVRHPIYLGELLLVTACFFASVDLIAMTYWVSALVAVVIRIGIEESLFNSLQDETSTGYASYCQLVKYRLLPGIW